MYSFKDKENTQNHPGSSQIVDWPTTDFQKSIEIDIFDRQNDFGPDPFAIFYNQKLISLMKTLFISLVFICTSLAPLTAQEIQVEKTFGGYKYTQNGQSLTIGDMVRIMEPNEEALPVMKQARSNKTFAGILGFAGGFCIGYPIGQAIAGNDPVWTLAGVGAGLIIIAIPISNSANKKAKRAVGLYNASIGESSFHYRSPQLELMTGDHGLGICVRF